VVNHTIISTPSDDNSGGLFVHGDHGRSIKLVYVLCVGDFIFRNQGPLQKVCRDADTVYWGGE